MASTLEAHPQVAAAPPLRSWRTLIAARLLVDGGATRAELLKDLGAIAAHRLSPAELRLVLDREVAILIAEGAAQEQRGRLGLTPAGHELAASRLGLKAHAKPAKLAWNDIRDIRLVALALGIEAEAATRLKLLGRPDGLRAAAVQTAFGLAPRSRTSPARLRSALAVLALQRAFGNSIKDAMDAGKGLSAKAGRLLAGQLADKPRDFGTDARLIATLAAQAFGSARTDVDALRAGILRKLVDTIAPPPAKAAGPAVRPPPAVAAVVAAAPTPAAAVPPPAPQAQSQASAPVTAAVRPQAASRPDLTGFARVVLAIASQRAEGWPGNRKAFISDVWQAIRDQQPQWGLTEIEFKSMLAEAHRTGHVVLANCDLKDRRSLPRVQQSALAFKNSVLHLVRVAD